MIDPNKERINVGTTGHVDWGKPIVYTPAWGYSEDVIPLVTQDDYGKRSKKKGKQRKDWQI